MSKAFTIPSVFTAIDKFSSPIKNMGNNVSAFASKTEAGIARSERIFRKMTPALSDATKQFFSFASAAALTAGILATISFSIKSVRDYDDALASFRTIVGGTNEEFSKFYNQALIVGKATKTSAVEVVKAFESISGLNADLAETPEILGEVTKAAIVLSKGSGDELQSTAENLVGILNQFNMKGSEATRVIDVLAAGQAYGASSIIKSAEAFKVFGAVAADNNVSIEQANGLLQVLGSQMILGSEAGTALRGSISLLQKSGFGFKKGKFDILDALEEAKSKLDKLKTDKQKKDFIATTFGLVNKTAGTILLNNIDSFKMFTEQVSQAGEAEKAAAVKGVTLTAAMNRLSSGWTNMVLSTEAANSSLSSVVIAIDWLETNLESVISVGFSVLAFFAGWKALLIGSKVAMVAYNIAYGINNALQKKSLFYTQGNIYAKYADLVTTKLVIAATWAWNAALAANPIVWVVIGIMALVAAVILVIKYWDQWGAAVAVLAGPFGFIISLVQSFRRNWDMITQAFTKGGILAGLKAIKSTLLDAVLMPLQQILSIIARVSGFDWAADAANKIEQFRKEMGVELEGSTAVAEPVDLNSARQESFEEKVINNNQKVEIGINSRNADAQVESNSGGIPLKLSSTFNR